jgi:ferritin-like metal-binding protein YciE
MADQRTINERDTKLVQWLNEAYAKEAELEVDLAAHIALTQKASYKKRLRAHLTETRDHKKKVQGRIKKLGGGAPNSGPQVPGVPALVGEVAGKAVAAVKGQVGTARAAVTSQAETHLRNAQEELREEHVEIALYTRIETFATEVGDKETAQLARTIRRDEERMAKFLDAELKRLVKEVVRAEVPRDQRGGTTTRRRSTSSRSRSASSSSRSTGTRSRSAASSRSGSSRSSGSGSGSGSGNGSASGSRARATPRSRSTRSTRSSGSSGSGSSGSGSSS